MSKGVFEVGQKISKTSLNNLLKLSSSKPVPYSITECVSHVIRNQNKTTHFYRAIQLQVHRYLNISKLFS